MMKTYAKPMILANDELAEGVYAASGAGDDCWTNFRQTNKQVFDLTKDIIEIHMDHKGHGTEGFTATFGFTGPVTAIEDCSQGVQASANGTKYVTVTYGGFTNNNASLFNGNISLHVIHESATGSVDFVSASNIKCNQVDIP